MKLTTPRKFILESFLLALLMTSLPIGLLVFLNNNRLITPFNMVAWLLATLAWTALVVVLYMKKGLKGKGFILRS
ncbi:MAG: hypothetical protein QXS57_00245 [Candidatus Caldarchaeum sp.]|uniref:Uncharacterized protein n=1 Tax=Caldiarchaeum subterraneum TaxID=311458 RepID=A0A7J3VUN7_CALS0